MKIICSHLGTDLFWCFVFVCFFFLSASSFPPKALGTDGLNVPTRTYSAGGRRVDVAWCRVQLYSLSWKIARYFVHKVLNKKTWPGHLL